MADVIWRVPSAIYAILVEILADMLETDDWSDDYMCLLDQVKSLPGYPLTLNENFDTLIVEEVGSIRSLSGAPN
jgi:hypothetical protein